MFRKVPKGTNWFYTLGSATMFAFLSQAVTGVFLAMYYRPDPSGGAYESIRYVTNDVFLGQFVRGMHKWGSSVMVILVFLHMARTFFFGAYKYPRELNWVIGVVLLILTMVMSFTGYLLPFDQRAYWATIVGVNINGTGPLIGPYLSDFLRGGLRIRRDDAVALLCHPHAADPRPARRADRRPSLPGGQARHDRAALDESREATPSCARPRCSGDAPPRDGRQPAIDQRRAMNQREKEEYLREYAILKAQGKPFFPYAVAKDAVMACVVMAVIITMSLVLGAELGSKANPTTTTYVPRPEWYFFFLFEVLRVIKPPSLVGLATIGVPTIAMILLFLLPFYDRGPERRPERRPIATVTGIVVIGAMAFLTYQGANAGSPTVIEMATPDGDRAGRRKDPRRIRSRQGGRRPVGLPGLPQDRRQRQRRSGARPDPHRRAAPPPGDRAHAREPDGADAVVQEPAAAEVQGGRQLPVAAEVAFGPCPLSKAPGPADRRSPPHRAMRRGAPARSDLQSRGESPGRAAGGPGARDVRSHRGGVRPDEHRDDRRPAPSLARACRRARAGWARATRVLDVATGTGDLAIELARRVSPGGEVVGCDFAEGMLARARAKAPAQSGLARAAAVRVGRRAGAAL